MTSVFGTPARRPRPPAPGGGVATACDTCHEFAPNDDHLDANSHPDAAKILADFGYSPQNPTDYTYSEAGDHIAHGFGDRGSPLNPTAADAAGSCDICHPAAVTTYTNSHMNGTKDLRSGSIGRANGTDNGTWNSGTRTCSNVDCHLNQTTPAWGNPLNISCTACHNNGTNDGDVANAWPTSGSHAMHAGSANYAFDCTQCHPDNRYPTSLATAR